MGLVLGLGFLFVADDARALDPRLRISQYIRDTLQTKDGLPEGEIRAIAQTSDGYLWFGTEEGLVRFDGVEFRVFDTSNTVEFESNFINDLVPRMMEGFGSPRCTDCCISTEAGLNAVHAIQPESNSK